MLINCHPVRSMLNAALSFCVFTLLAVGCGGPASHENTDLEKVVYEKGSGSLFTADFVKEIVAIALESSEASFIGDMSELLPPAAEGYYVIEQDLAGWGNQKRLLHFAPDGKFVQTIGRVGRGLGEYNYLRNVQISKNEIELYAGVNAITRYTYAKDGQFLREAAFPYKADQLMHWEGYDWAYLNHYNQYGPDRLIKVDATGEKVNGFLPSDAKILPMSMDFAAFSLYGERLFLRESINYIIYEIQADTLLPRYQFDFGSLNVPDNHFTYPDVMQAADVLFASSFANIDYFYENDFCTLVGGSINGKNARATYVGVKHKGRQQWQWFSFPREGQNSELFVAPFVLGDNSAVYCLVSADKLLQLSAASRGKFSNPQLLDALKEDDNCVLLKFVIEK